MDRGVCSIHAREGPAKLYRRLSSGRARMKDMAPGDARPGWAIAAYTVIYLAVADRRVRNMGASVRSLRSAWCRFHSRRLGLAITRKLARMMGGEVTVA